MVKKPFRVEAVLPENARTYFLERDSAAFRALLAKVLKLGAMEMTDVRREGESTFVRMVTRPDFGNWVPKGLQSQVNMKNVEFHDVIEYRPSLIQRPPFQINVKTESPFLGEKLDVRLELVIEEIDENTCRQVLQGHIKVNMFGVGRIVEGIVKDSLQNTYKKLPEIVRRWQAFRREAVQSGNVKQLIAGRPPVGNNIDWIRAEVLTVMQAPIEAEADLPLPSPSGVVSPEDLSQFSTDEAAAAGEGGPAAGAVVAAAPAAAAAAAAVLDGEELEEGRSVRSQLRASNASCKSEYYDALETLDDTATSSPLLASGSGPSASARPYRPQDTAFRKVSFSEGTEPAAAAQQQQQQQQEQRQESQQRRGVGAKDVSSLRVHIPTEESPGWGRHRRGISMESAGSSTLADSELLDANNVTSPFQSRPTSKKSWRGFNNQYEEWTTYWDILGVKHMAPREPHSGPLAFLYKTEDFVRESASTIMFTAYLFALRKGLITAEPNRDGRYMGKAPRLDLEPRPQQQREREQLLQAHPSPTQRLLRQMSAPVVPAVAQARQQQRQQQQQPGGGPVAGVEAVVWPGSAGGAEREGSRHGKAAAASGISGISGISRQSSLVSQYGDTDKAAALVERLHLRMSSLRGGPGAGGGLGGAGHRRAVSVDTGTAAAARAEAAKYNSAAALGASSRLGGGGAGGPEQQQGGMGAGAGAPRKRRSTAIPLASTPAGGDESDDGLVHPRSGFSCIPACWGKRPPRPPQRQ